MSTLPTRQTMYRALARRDASYEGIFYACVRTTGIFCRPTCPARKPRAVNVDFVPTPQAALKAGYRACLRCRPLDSDPDRPAWVGGLLKRLSADPETRLRDADLPRLGIDPARARRYFKQHFGVTFQAYQRAGRLGAAMKALNGGETISNAALDSGFESESGFRDAFTRLFGTPPGKGRRGECPTATWIPTPLGTMVAIAADDGLLLLEFGGRASLEREIGHIREHYGTAVVPGRHPHLTTLKRELKEYFQGKRTEFSVPLRAVGTPFQRKVWNHLVKIPYGVTSSYGDLAQRVGRPGASRAVGRINGQNPIAIVVPCHRVVGASGKLTGYGGGLWRKKWLLDLEAGERPPAP